MDAPDPEPQAASAKAGVMRALRAHPTRVFAFLLFAAGVPLCFLETPLWWLGGSLLLACVPLLRVELTALRGRSARTRPAVANALGHTVCLSIVTLIALTMVSDVLGGERPVSHDHTIHFAKAWLLHEDLLSRGQIYGWTQNWFAGYPANYLYPPGADLWINAVYVLSFGALTFSQAYAGAFALFHVLTGVSAYVLGCTVVDRAAGRRTLTGYAVALLGAILCVTDPGFFRMGGWKYTVEYGVWPQALSLSFAILGIACLPAIVKTRKLAPIGMFGLWMGLAFITHPIQLIFLAITVLVAALAATVADSVRAATALFRLMLGVALSAWVGALWALPFFSTRAETNQMGVWWDTTYEMAKGLLDAQLFPGTLAYVFAFGMLGIVVMLRTKRFMLLFIGLIAITIPAITNSTMMDELHLSTLLGSLAKVQYLRLSTMVKPFWFVLAAYAVVAVIAHAHMLAELALQEPEKAVSKASIVRQTVLAGVIGLLTLPVVVPLTDAFATRHIHTSIMTESDRPMPKAREQLERWLKTNLPKGGFYRVGVFTGDFHDWMDLGSVIDRPLYKRGFTPASNFVYQPRDRFPSILEALNVRFAISRHPLPEQDFEKLVTYGTWSIYRFTGYRPETYRILEGAGDIRVERFGNELVQLRAGQGSHGKLRINVSYFSRWQAYRDGQPVPITITYLRDAPTDSGFITVPLAPGEYRFVFERTLFDRMALPIGLLGMLMCGVLVFADRRKGLLRRSKRVLEWVDGILDHLSEPSWQLGRRALLGLAICGGVAAFIALATWKPRIQIAELPNVDISRVRFDFIEKISRAHAGIRYSEAYRPCERQGDRLVCRNAEGALSLDNYVGNTPATLKDYILVRCMRARPVTNGTLHITYPSVPVGDAIVGYFGIERAGRLMTKRRPVEFRVDVGGRQAYKGSTVSDNQIHGFNIPIKRIKGRRTSVSFSVRAENVSRRYFCFHAQVVDLK